MTMILTKLLRKKHGRPRPSAPPSVARSFPLPSFSSASCLMTSFSQRLACFPASLVKAPLSRPSSSLIRNTIWRGVATAVERPAEFSFSSPSSLFFLPQPLLPRGKDANFCSYPPSFAATGQKSCSRSPRDANPFGACATRSGEGRKRRGIGSRLVHDGSSLQETRRFYHQHTSLRSHPATTRGRKVERDLSTATAPTDEEEEEERQNSLASTAGGGGGGGLGQRKEQESLRGALKGERGPTDKLKKERDEEEVSASADVEYQRAADALLKNLFAQVEQSDFEGLDDIDYQEGVLKITCESGETIVLNKHYATKQIWYASPLSGGDYFDYSVESSSGDPNTWKSVRSGRSLGEALIEELKQIASQQR